MNNKKENKLNKASANNYLLSICIPTYNRPREFERLLFGLAPQITGEVELVIRDDSTDYATQEIFEKVKARRKWNFNYLKGEKIGVDAANLLLLERARGKYVWWFCDDDEMRPGAIARVLELIKKYPQISFMWANFDFQKLGNPAVVRADGFFKDGNEILDTLGLNIGLTSTQIVKRERALPSLALAKKHIVGFSFAGLVPILYIISQPGDFYFLRGPYILCHPTTPEEFKKSFVKMDIIENIAFSSYGIDFYDIMMEFKDKFSQGAIRKILSVNFASLWRGMLVAWVGGWDTPKGKRWRMFKYYWNFPEFWIAMPLFLMPLWVNKILFKIYKVFFSHRKWIFGENSKPLFK
ncbi:MAG: glycosyltransferase family 2 protein [bacterium]|nr:glycosyltransferase family 2 protein [bacterium]